MKLVVALLIALDACARHAAPPAPPPPPPAPPPTAAPAAPPPAPTAPRAVLQPLELVATWNECSNAGGVHGAFALGRSALHVRFMIHAGGHAVYATFGARTAPTGRGDAHGWFVGEVMMADRVDEDHDGNPDSSGAGWCLDGMPHFRGEVLRLWPVADEAEALRVAASGTAPTAAPTYQARWLRTP